MYGYMHSCVSDWSYDYMYLCEWLGIWLHGFVADCVVTCIALVYDCMFLLC